jgi:hypothetical protein
MDEGKTGAEDNESELLEGIMELDKQGDTDLFDSCLKGSW